MKNLTPNTISDWLLPIPEAKNVYRGKVRDVYPIGADKILLLATDRLSAFDVVMPKGIPFKGQVLNQIAAFFLESTRAICPNWLEDIPDPNISIGKRCEVFPVEVIVRAYLAGHAWREYRSGKRTICGVSLPEGLKENDRLPFPIITPSTKAEQGDHDEDISEEDILKQGILSQEEWESISTYAMDLFSFGTRHAEQQNLILVDTKFEFGRDNEGIIRVVDEILTPDSSRYFYANGYTERQEKGEKQQQLSKEFVRQWLIEQNFQGKEGQVLPDFTEEKIEEISKRYQTLYTQILGKPFIPEQSPLQERYAQNLKHYIHA